MPGFASAAECKWLIAEAASRLKRAGVYNNPTGVDPGRTNQSASFNFANADMVVEMVRYRIANQIGAPLACLEMPQALHYDVGQEFVLHCDFLDPQALREEIARNGKRIATVLIYLNEDYEGGQTSFPRLGLNHRGKTGDALVFGSIDAAGGPDPRSQHAGCPPTRGEKWVFRNGCGIEPQVEPSLIAGRQPKAWFAWMSVVKGGRKLVSRRLSAVAERLGDMDRPTVSAPARSAIVRATRSTR